MRRCIVGSCTRATVRGPECMAGRKLGARVTLLPQFVDGRPENLPDPVRVEQVVGHEVCLGHPSLIIDTHEPLSTLVVWPGRRRA